MFKVILALMHFSKLVFAFNFIPITPFVNTALYLGNIGSLFGILVLLSINPTFPFVNFKNWMPLSIEVFNAILVFFHLLPIYIFRHRQTLCQTFSPKSIATISAAFLVYFIILKNEMPLLYGVSIEIIGALAVSMLLFCLGVHAIFFWKQPLF